MSLNNVTGTIGTVVGLGITLGALGLALEFVDRSFDRASPNPRRSGKKRKPIMDMGGMGDFGNIFDPMPSTKGKKSQGENFYGGYGGYGY